MKISFQNQDIKNQDFTGLGISGFGKESTRQDAVNNVSQNGRGGMSVKLDIGNGVDAVSGKLFPGKEGKKGAQKSLTELQTELGNVDVSVAQDYRTVLSNTMSAKDYAKAQEEGFDYYTMDPDEVVTIQDRIKAEVAKGGEVITGYNDSLDGDVLAEALGSETLAREIAGSFDKADIPLTEENLTDVSKAWELAEALEIPTDPEKAYLIENELETDIWGLYLARSSGNISGNDISEESVDLKDPVNEKLLAQVGGILERAGYEGGSASEEGLNKAQWLLDRELPVNEENLRKLEEIDTIEYPVTAHRFAEAVAKAIAEGRKPLNADLVQSGNMIYAGIGEDLTGRSKAVGAGREGDAYRSETVIQKAIRLESYYSSEEALNAIGSRVKLEEIRLSMTAEVNIRLLESDFSIDTAPIEDFISALKEAEKQVAARYFPDEDAEGEAVGSYRLMNEVDKAVSDIRETPAANLGMFTVRTAGDVAFGEFHLEGVRLKDTYERAGESYEALMTAPRADLGDSIRKAFANVSSLADGLGIEATEDNLRAIRILGYNNMELTPENVEKVSTADIQVRSLIEKMTPASVLGMIRDGINPLETSFAELSAYFDAQQTGGYETVSKSYSEFLYGLEMQDNITPEERESYIGIYRLIHQIEKSDSAAVGAVVGQQAELAFKNLLSAARTRRLHGVDVRVGEDFGAAADIIKIGTDITEQISAAFREQKYADDAENMRQAANVSREAAQLLKNISIPGSAENLIAMETLLGNETDLYRELSKYEKSSKRVRELAENLREKLDSDDFEDSFESGLESMESLAEEMTLSADSYIDVRAMSLIHRQLGLSAEIMRKGDFLEDKDYVIPALIRGEVSKVHISFRGSAGESTADIKLALDGEELEAYFELSSGRLEGYIAQNGEKTLKKITDAADIFVETLRKDSNFDDIQVSDIPVLNRDNRNVNRVSNTKRNSQSKDAKADNSDGSERRVLLQVTKLFLQTVGEV